MTFLEELEPRALWKHFDTILTIPRGSKEEAKIRQHVIRFAEQLGLPHRTDAVGNIVVATVHSGKVHVAGAALAIVGGNAAILAGSALIRPTRRWYLNVSKFIAVVGFLSLVMLVIDSATTTIDVLPSGVWERGSVYSITLWQLLTAACLLTDAGRRTERATITFR